MHNVSVNNSYRDNRNITVRMNFPIIRTALQLNSYLISLAIRYENQNNITINIV